MSVGVFKCATVCVCVRAWVGACVVAAFVASDTVSLLVPAQFWFPLPLKRAHTQIYLCTYWREPRHTKHELRSLPAALCGAWGARGGLVEERYYDIPLDSFRSWWTSATDGTQTRHRDWLEPPDGAKVDTATTPESGLSRQVWRGSDARIRKRHWLIFKIKYNLWPMRST